MDMRTDRAILSEQTLIR